MLRSILRPIAIVATLAGLASYAIITLRGPQGIGAWMKKREEIKVLELQNANLRRDIDAEKHRIDLLQHDPGTQQVEVEKHLGKVPPGATEFRELGQHLTPAEQK